MAEQSVGPDPEKIIADVKRQVAQREKLANYDGPDRVISWREYLEQKEEHSASTVRFQSGFAELDSYLDGFETGEVIVITGFTRNGKTLFSQSLMRNFGIQQIPVVVFSFEVATSSYLKPFQEHAMYESTLFVPKENRAGSLTWLEERIIEAKVKFNNRIALIDHLHYIVDMNPEKLTASIGAAMRRLKMLAVNLNQVIFLIAHQEKLKIEVEPSLETIRDSSFIGQECDTAIVVHRLPDTKPKRGEEPTYNLGHALVKIDKARRKGTFRQRLTFQKRGSWLEPI